MLDLNFTLEDKYRQDCGQVYLTGIQALVRLPMLQRQVDQNAGLNTAGFISGYRGSPLGGYDLEVWRARKYLEPLNIHFTPGLNEDLAATSVWGTQQVHCLPGAKYDGVFSIWYGKAPGVDRSGDVFKHGNHAGSSKHGGVLLLAGDDHASKSTSTTLQSEYSFLDAMIPVLAPAGVDEFIEFGLYGFGLSRFSGLWVGFKLCATNIDASSIVELRPDRPGFRIPNDVILPPDGLNARWPDDRLPQEVRLKHFKIPAALAFARSNGIDRMIWDPPKARFGILTAGKSYLDVQRALAELGIDEALGRSLGIRVYKLGMTWPIEPNGLMRFADGLEEILVVEEKRDFVEAQIKSILYDRVGGKGPRVVGKRDENGATLLQEILDHEPMMVASAIGARLMRYADSETLRARLGAINAQRAAAGPKGAPALARIPFFCSGCPHNTSTNVPEGSTALAGIGCHSLALYVGRATTFTHMGGEGASWIGMAPFTDTKHVFQNVGDGTYYHSGSLGIRAAIAAKVNMTFKVLYNAAVAMTGGQPVEGQPTVQQITWQLYGEGVVQTVVVNDEPLKYDWRDKFAPGVTIRHRDELDQVQRELREIPGVTVLLYDQTCAAEKRRKRKRGQFPDPQRRAFINDLVCEGCGDCSKVSNCVSVTPVETEYGRKRAIDQSACNKDYSCLKGFCPSFVTVEGGKLKKRAGVGEDPAKANVPPPILPSIAEPFPLLITGIGGTGVVTIGAILGVASRIAGQGCTVADITGLSQKNGPVMSQIMFAERQEQVASGQIAPGQAKALLACDMVTAAMPEAMSKLSIGHTRAVVNLAEVQTAEFTQNPDKVFPAAEIRRRLNERIDASQSRYIDASRIATSLMGDAVTVNMFLTGYAWQMEMIPLPWPALEQAIKLNGAQVEANLRAFAWGRRYAHEPDAVDALVVKGTTASIVAKPKTLDETIEDRAAFLVKYQNEAYAARYRQLVAGVRATEQTKVSGKTSLTEAVARYGFKLMAYKDEYEVARLHADPLFMAKLHDQFEGDFKIKFHLAPPAFAPRDPATGKLLKREFGSSMMSAFRLLGKFKFLRGTMLDPFGHTAERKQERKFIRDYEALMAEIAAKLTPANHAVAVALASIPEDIRGYGHIKDEHVARAKKHEAELLKAFTAPAPVTMAAE